MWPMGLLLSLIKSWWLTAWTGCQFPCQIWITMTDSKVKTVDKVLQTGLMKKYQDCQGFPYWHSVVIFKTWLKCVYIVKKTLVSVSIFTTQVSMYSCAICMRKSSKIEGNIPIISLYIMKFSLFYPIFQKIWPYEMPSFWVKRHLKPWYMYQTVNGDEWSTECSVTKWYCFSLSEIVQMTQHVFYA